MRTALIAWILVGLLVGWSTSARAQAGVGVIVNGVWTTTNPVYFTKVCFGTQASPTAGADISGGLLRFTSDCGTTLIGLSALSGTFGTAASVTGSVKIANGAGGGNLWTLASGATSAWTMTSAATAPAQGDLLTFSNGTGQMASVVDVTAGSYLRSGGAGAVPIYSTVTLPNTAATGNVLVASATNVISAATPASVNANPANQGGNATATLKMNGLGAAASPCILTPATSGRVGFNISGQIVQNTSADGIAFKMVYGTTTPPANAAAAEGTALTPTMTHTALTGALEETFSVTGVAPSLAKVATWFDLQVAEVTGGTASITNVTCSAWEF